MAHVNISYDGANGALHIDIVPADSRKAVIEVEQVSEVKTLPNQVEQTEKDLKTESVCKEAAITADEKIQSNLSQSEVGNEE